MVEEVECQNGQQHQQAAELCEEEKLQGRIDAPLVAPYNNQEIHRDQHQLPGEIKQEQIDRQEHADDSRQNPDQVEVEKAYFVSDIPPRSQHRHDAQEEREHQHQQAKTI